jgi:hypothetical protein
LIYRLHDKQITSTTLEKQHTEVLKVQDKYYGKLLQEMDEEMKKFYISGIYFTEKADIAKFFEYAKWLKEKAAGKFDKKAVSYALFEVLAEYKRRGVPKASVLKAMLSFDPFFLTQEVVRRKKTAREDIKKCMSVAERIGLKQTAGTKEYPIFE